MIKYRGVNIYPAAVEKVVHGIPEITDEFQIVLQGTVPRPELCIRVEPRGNVSPDERLVSTLEERFREVLGVRTRVEFVPPGTIPRSDFKARRVVDERAPA